VSTIAVDAIILYPVQTAANLLAYERVTSHRRRAALGLGMLLLTIVVALLVLPYWGPTRLPLCSPSRGFFRAPLAATAGADHIPL